MTAEDPNELLTVEEVREHELAGLAKQWWCLLLTGIFLIVGGIASIAYPWFTSFGVILLLGMILMISGVATIITAFWAGRWSAFLMQILIGILYLVAGFVITDAPLTSLALLTLMMAGFFVVGGSFRIITALVEKYPQWGWTLCNGVITLMLGLIIFRSFKRLPEEPNGVLWIIGLMVGLELVFNGVNWVMLSLAVREIPEAGKSQG